jgi:hypothetical protein
MTDRYTGDVPLDDVRSEFSMKFGNKIVVLGKMGCVSPLSGRWESNPRPKLGKLLINL